jgi:ATP-dependent DNA helicase PIF1
MALRFADTHGRSIGGTTIHSWAGIGLGTDAGDRLVHRVEGSKQAVSRWKEASALIIDESESWSSIPCSGLLLRLSLHDQRPAT